MLGPPTPNTLKTTPFPLLEMRFSGVETTTPYDKHVTHGSVLLSKRAPASATIQMDVPQVAVPHLGLQKQTVWPPLQSKLHIRF